MQNALKKLFLTMATLILFCRPSHAGLLLEPFLGYNIGSIEYTVSNTNTALDGSYEFDLTGTELGGRIGYSFLGLNAGLQYSMGSYTKSDSTKPAGVAASADDDYDATLMGAFIGFNFPILVRVWGTYYFDYTLEDTNGDDKGDEDSGSGIGLGIGFTPIPFLSINLEYRMLSIDEAKDATDGSITRYPSSTVGEIDNNMIFLSVSAPFDI